METAASRSRENKRRIRRNKLKTFFSKPQNIILLLFGIVLTITTIAPIIAIMEDTFAIHPGTLRGSREIYFLLIYLKIHLMTR